MSGKPKSGLPVIMAFAVTVGLTRLVLQKVKDDKEAGKAQEMDTGTPPQG
ncbi:hypothetical protein GCM10012320_06610 [Sinomonas cellulolyticus]|uniref:Uncharacterized protein n=1 Tax=Sinomonas cellulolyticus TaxID=2801916 RepID=A0ABS1K3G1_9MICC|nr:MULTISPECIES: hypothetical protein [Sinomonas]MBL0705988.1 hypothetical protein [Sinomonas cellulolyticus]GHG42946.1 hypothetical protein GCM10012320_06610 [Sinomonas sp. KCTC 49339]